MQEGLVNTECEVDRATMEHSLGSTFFEGKDGMTFNALFDSEREKLQEGHGPSPEAATTNNKIYAAIFKSILGLDLYDGDKLPTDVSKRRNALHCIRNRFEYRSMSPSALETQYDDADINKVLMRHVADFVDKSFATTFLFPIGALVCLKSVLRLVQQCGAAAAAETRAGTRVTFLLPSFLSFLTVLPSFP